MKRDQLVAIVQRIMDVDGTEEELDDLEAQLERNVPLPAVSDLIFYPPDGIALSAEAIVDLALACKAVPLGPPR